MSVQPLPRCPGRRSTPAAARSFNPKEHTRMSHFSTTEHQALADVQLTDAERQILADGCLINYYKNN